MEYEISKQLMPLYNYTYDRLVEGNIKSDTKMVQEAIDIIKELRDAWVQAMKKARQENGTKNVQGDSYVG
jgi:flagellar protein FliS